MNESGVFGGSMFGATFFHASTKASSTADAAGSPVERNRKLTGDRGNRVREIWRSMLVSRGQERYLLRFSPLLIPRPFVCVNFVTYIPMYYRSKTRPHVKVICLAVSRMYKWPIMIELYMI